MMKTTAIIALVNSLCMMAVFAEQPASVPSDSNYRVGVYDSRAIAIAFVGSDVYKASHGRKLAEMMMKYKKAKAENNQERMSELEVWGKAQQALLHKQGFSTAPVDDILKHVADQLPKIKKQAGVDLIVSKWDTQALAKHESAEQVDITMLLVEVFKPNDKQKKSAIEIQNHDPVPLEKMEDH